MKLKHKVFWRQISILTLFKTNSCRTTKQYTCHTFEQTGTQLQIIWGFDDNSGMVFFYHISIETCYNPLLEWPHWFSSKGGNLNYIYVLMESEYRLSHNDPLTLSTWALVAQWVKWWLSELATIKVYLCTYGIVHSVTMRTCWVLWFLIGLEPSQWGISGGKAQFLLRTLWKN